MKLLNKTSPPPLASQKQQSSRTILRERAYCTPERHLTDEASIDFTPSAKKQVINTLSNLGALKKHNSNEQFNPTFKRIGNR